MKIRVWAALLCAALCVPLAASAVEPMQPMTMMGHDAFASRDWARSEFFVRMEELTGVSFTFWQYSDAGAYDRAKADALGGGDLPDVLFKAGLTPQEELRYAQTGALIDLAPLLPDHAPSLWALLEAHPDWRDTITLPDGKIVALPALSGSADQVCLWINQGWLDTLKLEAPDSPESLRAALIAFRDGDPNRNGRKDEVPLFLVGPWEARWLLPFFGIAANDYNLYVDGAGAVQFAPFQPEFAEFLAYLRDLHEQGLLGAEAFRGVHALLEQIELEASTLRVGGLISLVPNSLVKAEFIDQFITVVPAAGMWRDLMGPVWRGTFAITSACPDPAAALRWVDALYTEEGAILAEVGKEGVDYEFNERGKWNFLLHEFRSGDSLRAESLMDPAGDALPGIRATDFLLAVDFPVQRHVYEQVQKVGQIAKLPIPLHYIDEEIQAEIDALQMALGALVDTHIARFALGEIPLDAEHLAMFEQSLREAGAERLMELWQGIVDGQK
ncbi:MAG: hypothetical protein FWE77_01430 [Clostridia bacterium]|nr:hypothetical protein [Clostridia bacterium]